MARRPKMWLHKQSGNYKVQIGKRQVNLGPDKDIAADKLYRLVSAGPASGVDSTCYDVFNRYLAFVEGHRSKSRFTLAKRYLTKAAKHLGKRIRVADLTPEHMHEWIAADYSHVSTTTQSDAISAVIAAINHYRIPNPLHRMEKPPRQQREFYLLPEQWQTLIDAVPDQPFRDYCVFGLHSGARPQEIAQMRGRHYEPQHGRIHFPVAELPKKTRGRQRPRYVYLDDTSREIVERNIDGADSFILLNSNRNQWNKDNTNCRFRRLKTKLDMPKLVAYTLRHSFAVWKLTEKVSVPMVAGLMGHINSRMVEERYGHIVENKLLMTAASQTGSPLSLSGSDVGIVQGQSV